jgi:hypothetical protein
MAVTDALRSGPGPRTPIAHAATRRTTLSAMPGTWGSSLSIALTNATIATTANPPAAAPSTCAKPGRGRRSARQPR